jgi:hypothetical protein
MDDIISALCRALELGAKQEARIRRQVRKDKSGDRTLGAALCFREAYARANEREPQHVERAKS